MHYSQKDAIDNDFCYDGTPLLIKTRRMILEHLESVYITDTNQKFKAWVEAEQKKIEELKNSTDSAVDKDFADILNQT